MSAAMDAAIVAITRTARHKAFHTVKARARHYRRFRLEMGMVHRALPFAHPRAAIAIGAHLVEAESRKPARFPAPVALVNARAVLLLGRWDRRFGERITLVAAE